MDQKKEGEGGGGGGGESKPAADAAKELADLKASNAALLERFNKLEAASKKGGSGGAGETDDEDLNEKARKQREADDKKSGDSKALEAALRFDMSRGDFLKSHASILPKDVTDIFAAADKETYGSAVEKDSAVKAGLIQSFFAVQANVDALTPGHKSQLEDYLKLTKNGKQEKAAHVYSMIFEPALEMLKRTKKAEALSKGHGSSSDVEQAYKQKLMNGSQQHFNVGAKK
jgi:hypothetical protein